MALSDIEAVYRIEQTSYTHPWSKNLFLTNFGKRYFNHVLIKDNHLIGYFVCSSVEKSVSLLNISISPLFQGKQHGKSLLSFLCALSIEKGKKEIWLEVRRSNTTAIALYKSFNFVEVEVRKNYYPTKDGKEDGIMMCCYLT
ncbi:MAG: ribosomal protein S18-alanine N-acetyltransferase [Psychromonas sp.]|nr:ribosomal protein S18-alanine N-acetyltransferase [Psychromonas sp.]